MRRPRADVAWSRGRVRRRAFYQAYITSPEWFARRERWLAEWQERRQTQPFRSAPASDSSQVSRAAARDASPTLPVCVVGGCLWSLEAGDLHHVTYDRLGAERFEDLIPMCRRHHTRFHDVYDAYPSWRRMGRRAATRGIVAALRAAEKPTTTNSVNKLKGEARR